MKCFVALGKTVLARQVFLKAGEVSLKENEKPGCGIIMVSEEEAQYHYLPLMRCKNEHRIDP
jgi:hypothetical protein